jgi:hypothetical protein
LSFVAETGIITPDFFNPDLENFGALSISSEGDGRGEGVDVGIGVGLVDLVGVVFVSAHRPEDDGARGRCPLFSEGGEVGGDIKPRPVPLGENCRWGCDAQCPASCPFLDFVGLSLSIMDFPCLAMSSGLAGGLNSPPRPI